ncbi:hypothetical protein [Protofrankia symbiont of Coriaria ruscifolia]|uniref:Uncharacterized protein n=1 Tax=Candidatus Protofrankia californiensis TaxID=1839754 RepID=A0A1C3NTT2_9ACTN|nr:hypothetical protein [Protofrankia symbiont of Coriaria ruscifolia]SBW18145.1 hypothetical protein FDG2_0540 [Candidatus Protofrankia californiensis]
MALPVRSVERPATMVRWDPFQEIEDAWTRMGSLLGDVVGRPCRSGVSAGWDVPAVVTAASLLEARLSVPGPSTI